MKMAFNEDAIKYNHIIRLCPYFSYGCSELIISIVDGAHPQLQALQFTKDNIRWCCGDETQTKIEGFAFFPGKSLSKKLLHKIGLGLHHGLKITVCLAKSCNVSIQYKEVCWQNIVMRDVQYYWKLISGTCKN